MKKLPYMKNTSLLLTLLSCLMFAQITQSQQKWAQEKELKVAQDLMMVSCHKESQDSVPTDIDFCQDLKVELPAKKENSYEKLKQKLNALNSASKIALAFGTIVAACAVGLKAYKYYSHNSPLSPNVNNDQQVDIDPLETLKTFIANFFDPTGETRCSISDTHFSCSSNEGVCFGSKRPFCPRCLKYRKMLSSHFMGFENCFNNFETIYPNNNIAS